MYAFFWVNPWLLNFICQCFRTLCLFHLHRRVDLPMFEDGTECSKTLAYKFQTPGIHPKESIQQSLTYPSKGLEETVEASVTLFGRYDGRSCSHIFSWRENYSCHQEYRWFWMDSVFWLFTSPPRDNWWYCTEYY